MDRRHLYTGLIAAAVALAAGLWWFAGHSTFQVFGGETVRIAGQTYEVRRFEAVAPEGEPEKMRACFRVDEEIEAPPELDPRPTPGPDWFKCFNARFLNEMLAKGEATAYVAERNDPEGYDRIVAVLPGNRVYMWRQPN